MSELKSVNPIVHDRYKEGGFVIRRSDRYWAGLPCDLVIEQVFMRSLKSTGSLTRGSGMTAVQRAIWILSQHICSKYGLVMEENTGVLYTNSEQHQSATKPRVTRDKLDTDQLRTIYRLLTFLLSMLMMTRCSPLKETLNASKEVDELVPQKRLTN